MKVPRPVAQEDFVGKPASDIRWEERSRPVRALPGLSSSSWSKEGIAFYLENLIPHPFMFVGVFQEVNGIDRGNEFGFKSTVSNREEGKGQSPPPIPFPKRERLLFSS